MYLVVTSVQSWAAPSCRESAFSQDDLAYASFTRWSLDDFTAASGTSVLLKCSNCPSVPQRISVTMSDTSTLFLRVLDLAQGATFVQRSQAKNALSVLEKRQFNRGMQPYFLQDDVDSRTRNRVRKHNLRFQELLDDVERVEVGAWDITLENGDHRAAIFTSNDPHMIDSSANEKSLRGILASLPPGTRIKKIEFIHNHPSSVSLSSANQRAMMWAKSFVALLGYPNVPIRMTAIQQKDQAVIAMSMDL